MLLEHPQPPGWQYLLSLEERLEDCEVVYFPRAPFALPEGDDRRFLLDQKVRIASKNISYDPATGRAHGFQRRPQRIASACAISWPAFRGMSAAGSPRHALAMPRAWRLDRVSFRPVEEATRQLRLKARNDLLHVDAFPSRPTRGHRILRCFANINPSEPRVWVTSDPFDRLLARYGPKWAYRARGRWPGAARVRTVSANFPAGPAAAPPTTRSCSASTISSRRTRNSRKSARNAAGRSRPDRPGWSFRDAVSHAVLRGRFALEHSYFVSRPKPCSGPRDRPAALLEQACGVPVRAARLSPAMALQRPER